VSTLKIRILACCLPLVIAGCGAEGGDDGPLPDDVCGFGSDRYLPYQLGFTWSYQVTNVESGERKIKDQSLEEEIEHPDFGRVIVQLTGKLAGSTRSLLRVEGDRVVRFLQEDLDVDGVVERTTTYDPPQIRIDESPDRTTTGASWEEAYDETEVDAAGSPVTLSTTDAWEVLGVDVACTSPLGDFECLHLRRTRTVGGVAVKEFHFARGVGKIRESGDNQVEELTACGR